MSTLFTYDAPTMQQEESEEEPRTSIFAGALVTVSLIFINVVVYVVIALAGVSPISPTGQQLAPWGANFGPLTMHGQWWRLVTACFLHFGIIHLAFNMYILFQVGLYSERLFGEMRYLLLYLLAGVGGNIAGLYFHPDTVSAGASGAIFGLYGGLLAFLLMQRDAIPKEGAHALIKYALIFIVYNLVFGLTRPETDITAHIGGLLTGFLCGCVLSAPLSTDSLGHRSLHLGRILVVAIGGTALAIVAVEKLPKRDAHKDEWLRAVMVSPRLTVGQNDVLVYAGSATKSDAQKLAPALVKVGLLRKPGVLLVLTRDNNGAALLIPFKGDETAQATEAKLSAPGSSLSGLPLAHTTLPWEDPALLRSLAYVGPQLTAALGTTPLTLRLLNSKGERHAEIRIDAVAAAPGRN